MYSSAAPSGADLVALQQRPFVVRDGRSYVADPTLHYPLPVDLTELHRQSLRTLLLIQLFNGPLCSPVFSNRPPTRVLEVGCGSAFWSMMCHRYYARHGHTNISFTGIDVAPIAPGTSTSARAGSTSAASGEAQSKNTRASASSATSTTPLSGLDGKPDKDMRWRFVQHDMRRLPWPFPDGEFDLVMVKDMSLATPLALQQTLMDEYVRLLRPGGVLEVWESDHTVRMLRPHVPESGRQQQQQQQQAAAAARNGSRQKDEDSDDDEDDSSEEEEDEEDDDDDDSDDDDDDDDDSDEDENEAAANLGAYLMTPHTPLSAPTNNYLVEYNAWVARALEARSLSAVPCTLIGSLLLQEVDTLTALGSKRLAVPLSEVRWEREGVGGVVTKDGKSYVESTKGYPAGKKGVAPAAGVATASAPVAGTRPALGPGQAAVRRTALMTVVQQIQSLEAVLREVSGKSQDEWDGWCGKMMNDLVKDNGTSWGECLEIGAWWARKKA
jgi:SAM-dependent methyltransferase